MNKPEKTVKQIVARIVDGAGDIDVTQQAIGLFGDDATRVDLKVLCFQVLQTLDEARRDVKYLNNTPENNQKEVARIVTSLEKPMTELVAKLESYLREMDELK